MKLDCRVKRVNDLHKREYVEYLVDCRFEASLSADEALYSSSFSLSRNIENDLTSLFWLFDDDPC